MLGPGDMAVIGAGDLEDRMRLIAYMIHRGYVDPWSHEWVSAVVRQCPSKAEECELRALFAQLAHPNIRYTFHPRGKDRFQTLRRTVELGTGDCDNETVAICTAAHILGFKVGARVYSFDGDSWGHIAPMIALPRELPTKSIVLELTDGPKGTPESARFGFEVALSRVKMYRDFWFNLT